MDRLESANEICERFAPEIGAAVLREKPTGGFKWRGRHFDLVIVVTSRNEPEVVDPTVPPEVRPLRESYREVFRALVELRTELGFGVRIGPKAITDRLQAIFDRAGEPRDASEHTVNHALKELEGAKAVHWTRSQGWLVGPAPVLTRPVQPEIDFGAESLPSIARQTARACSVAEITHASRTAREGAERPTREPSMFGKQIWIAGEKCDWTGGLIVTDANGNTHLLDGKQERVRYEGRTGRVATPPAVRCELVNVEDDGRHQVATVKVRTTEGRKTIRVRALGDWQLDGRMSDREEPAEIAANN